MVGKVTPAYIVKPAGMLVWDGTDFYALKGDAAGNLVLGSKLESGDQLISYKDTLVDVSSGNPSGAGGYRDSGAVPANTIWVLANICVYDATTATTVHGYKLRRGGVNYEIAEIRKAFVAGERSNFIAPLYMVTGDVIRVYWVGSLVGDTCVITLVGYSMTKV